MSGRDSVGADRPLTFLGCNHNWAANYKLSRKNVSYAWQLGTTGGKARTVAVGGWNQV